MDHVRNPMYVAEPYEESQGKDSSPASPADLAAFYRDMEQKEIVERKLSKRRSNSSTSIWSRKSVKRSATAPPAPPPIHKSPPKQQLNNNKGLKEVEEREAERSEEITEKLDWVPSMNSPRSIIPETMKELPAWYNKDTWASVPLPSFKLRYNLHNPVGPRWYKNHHLIPPSQVRPTARPPTIFSPSFPPITSSVGHERSEESTRVAGPSRTSSNSPLATPSSSQTRVVDGNKPRSRKTSETAHDNVDLLDVTDPWGTNWHHHSPYDIGLGNEPVSVDVQNPLHARARRFSLSAQSRRKTVTPSPLSQSTSAVHLHIPDTSTIHLPRKLSKRRTPAVGSIFGSNTQEPARNAVSLPATPVEHVPYSVENLHPSQLPKRMSVAPLASASSIQTHDATPKKAKRGSVLGRLVKKFSILRKSTEDQTRVSGRGNDWQHVNPDQDQRLDPLEPPAAPEKPQSVISKRVPPPSIDAGPSARLSDKPRDTDRSSSISLEAPFSMGRLTITNPDTPGSADTTPMLNTAPLPSESRAHDSYINTYLAYNDALQRDPQTPLTPESSTDPLSRARSLVQSPPSSERSHVPLPSSTSEPIQSPIAVPSTRTPKPPHSPEPQSLVPDHDSKEPFYQPSTAYSTYSDSPSTLDSQKPGPPTERSITRSPPTVTLDRRSPSEESHTSRTSRTSQVAVAQSAAGSPSFSSSVPFPITPSANGPYLAPGNRYSYSDSPLSAASMLANPPTPYSNDMSIPATPELPPPALPSKISQQRKSSSHESSSNNAPGRQTETFKLIRSSSGNVYASSETIVAGGQQWEVVESLDNKGKGKGKVSSKPDSEMNSRREQKRDGKTKPNGDVEKDSRNRSQRRSQRQRSSECTDPIETTRSRRTSNDSHHRADTGTTDVRHNPTRSSRKRDEDRKSDRKLEKFSVPVNVNKPQPAPPPPTPGAPPRPLQRNPSISARPTSELPSTAEMNALRAKEAWEMERLWKARSMYGDEANGIGNAVAPANDSSSKSNNQDKPNNQDTMHGSSHTAFVVQTPFQSQPPQIYHSMPKTPPQIIYPPAPSTNTHQHPASPPNQQSQYFTPDYLSSHRKSLTPSLRPVLTNPLPEPPRESTYEPAPIPLDIGSTDYWTKYTGLATSH